MSRIARMPIEVPDKVEAKLDGNNIVIKGPLGELKQEVMAGVSVNVADKQIKVDRDSDDNKNLQGLLYRLIINMIEGVTKGYKKSLEICGVGFRAALEGKVLVMNLSFSHPIRYTVPEGIKIEVEKNVNIHVSGIDKQQVGEAAATIRRYAPAEPYKGKGIKYAGEQIRRKAGKTVS